MKVTHDVDLTERQWEVVRLVGGHGLSYKRVGRRLGISYATVRWHATEARNRAGLDMAPYRAVLHLWYQARAEGAPTG